MRSKLTLYTTLYVVLHAQIFYSAESTSNITKTCYQFIPLKFQPKVSLHLPSSQRQTSSASRKDSTSSCDRTSSQGPTPTKTPSVFIEDPNYLFAMEVEINQDDSLNKSFCKPT